VTLNRVTQFLGQGKRNTLGNLRFGMVTKYTGLINSRPKKKPLIISVIVKKADMGGDKTQAR